MSSSAEIMLRIESLILRGENVSIEGEGDANREGGWRMVVPPQSVREVPLRIVQFDKLFLDTVATYVERNKIRVLLNGTVLAPDIIRELRRRDLSEILGEVVPHQIDGPFHTALGLTPGDVLTAITPTSIGFQAASGGIPTGATPPASPSDGALWFYTTKHALMYYDAGRGKWFTVDSFWAGWAHDTANGNALRGFGIDTAAPGTGVPVFEPGTIIGVTARARGGDLTKGFRLQNGVTTIHSFNLVGGYFRDTTLNIDLNQGDDVWAYADSVGSISQDVTVFYLFKWRVTP